MITCPKCGKENQDHYKFCLGCGSELPRDVGASQRSFSTPTPPAGIPVAAPPMGPAPVASGPAPGPPPGPPPGPAFEPGPEPMQPEPMQSEPVAFADEPPAAFDIPTEPEPAAGPAAVSPPLMDEPEPTLAPVGAGMVNCPNCGAQNPAAFKFCGACGAKLEDAVAAEPAAPVATGEEGVANLVLIRPDGSEGGAFGLSDGTTTVGRSTGQIFSADAYLSPDHATFQLQGGTMTVKDEGSLNGVYIRVAPETPIEIASGDVVRMGQELVRVQNLEANTPSDDGTELMGSIAEDAWGRVSLIVGDGQTANTFTLAGEGIVLGRERGDVLFPEDGYVSGTHVRIQRQGEKIVITDLNSSNGTFLRVAGEQDLTQGDYILMGQQLFRVDF